MRIIALPLSRLRPDRPAMVFYLAQLPPKPKTKPDSRFAVLRKRGLVKLADTWDEWGKKDGGWQVSR